MFQVSSLETSPMTVPYSLRFDYVYLILDIIAIIVMMLIMDAKIYMVMYIYD